MYSIDAKILNSRFAGKKLIKLAAMLLVASTWLRGDPALAATDPLGELRQLVDVGSYDRAYEIARQHQDLQGNPHFDFLFGLAAIHAGHHSEGVLALERHLSVIPANDRARLELARGYFELGDYLRARQEFEFVLKYNPPQEVRANIERYFEAMQTRESASRPSSARRYLEFGGGYDTNVNAGTFNSVINLPTPVVIVDPNSKSIGAYFWQFTGGGQWIKRVTPGLAVFAGGDFDAKQQPSESDFDTHNLGGYLGFSVFKGPTVYRLSLADGMLFVNNAKYRNTLSITGEAQYGLGNGYSLTGVAQYAELSHQDANSIRDSRLLTLVAGAQKSFQAAWRPTAGVQLSLADEDNLQSRDDLGRTMFTSRVFLGANPMDKLGINAGLSWQRSQFNAVDIAFGTVRKDELWTADLGVDYALENNWTLRAEFLFSENDSNQNLYSYKRKLVGLKTRYLF